LQHPIAALTSVSAALGDYDDDGDLDLFLSGAETALFENIIDNSNTWVLFSLEGAVSNRSAVGAKIKVKANIDGNDVWQIREVSSQNSFNGHNDLRVHFGLKDAAIIDSMTIMWPGSPAQVFENVEINTQHKYVEPITDNFIRVNFKSNIQFGFETPEIQFTDISDSDPNNPIVSWEWDFDNDGTIDATDQNPIWAYDSIGVYDVKLKVSNGTDNAERVKENFIELILTPGLPIISSVSHSFIDTTVQKGQRIEFSGTAEDTTGYDIIYNWELNSNIVDWDSTYRYAARSFPFVPRTDTLKFLASNGFNTTERIWYINVEDPTSAENNKDIPKEYELSQNYPNPFNPTTIISYTLPQRSNVSLKIYDLLGRELISLINEEQNQGYYSIDFSVNSAEGTISSGIYIYQLRAGNFIQSRKMMLLK
jgi:PKD repeat protein